MHPRRVGTQYTYSSHEDVFATVFDFMGLEGPSAPILAGKSLLRYDPARDLSVLGYGLTGSQIDDRLGIAGDGLKVVFVNRPPFVTVTVYRDGDVARPDAISAGHRGPRGRPQAPRRRRANHPLRIPQSISTRTAVMLSLPPRSFARSMKRRTADVAAEADDPGDVVVSQVAVETVAAEQEARGGGERDAARIDLHVFAVADRARDDVTVR